MPEQAEPGVEKYVEACAAASDRGRTVLVAIITATILVFAALWNAQPYSWLNLRLKRANDAVTWWGWDPAVKATLGPEDQEAFDRSRAFAEARGLACRECSDQMKLLRDELRRSHLENVTILGVPIFGITLDVNDLGILGGLTFMVLLLWLRFSLVREAENLRWAFKIVGSERKQLLYNLLAMHQVLTMPPPPQIAQADSGAIRRPAPFLHKLPFFFPAAVQALVFAVDIRTWRLGLSLSPVYAFVVYAISLTLLVLISLLTYFCWKASLDVDAEWRAAHRSAYP